LTFDPYVTFVTELSVYFFLLTLEISFGFKTIFRRLNITSANGGTLTRWISLILKLKPFCETTKHDHDDDDDSKITPIEAWTGPEGFRSWRFPEFLHNQHVKGARLSVLRTGRCKP
jgi:hypothetical protein